MKLKEVVAMLGEFAKVAGEDCEVQIDSLRLYGKMVPDYSVRYLPYGESRPLVPGYFIVVEDYARQAKCLQQPEQVEAGL